MVATVTEMLEDIERDGLDAVREHAARLDRWTGSEFRIDQEQIAQSGQRLPSDLKSAIEVGSRRTRAFARAHRAKLEDFEFEAEPGILTGVRYVPVGRVGAYLPPDASR